VHIMQQDLNSIPRETSVAGPDRPDDRQDIHSAEPPLSFPSIGAQSHPSSSHTAEKINEV